MFYIYSSDFLMPTPKMRPSYPYPGSAMPYQNQTCTSRSSTLPVKTLALLTHIPNTAIMAKNRKPIPPSANNNNKTKTNNDNKMDLDNDDAPPAPQTSKNPPFLLTANTHAGITKPSRLPRGKGRRAQRIRKEKGAERAEEVQARTARKVERSHGKGRRKGERNVSFFFPLFVGVKGGELMRMGDRRRGRN